LRSRFGGQGVVEEPGIGPSAEGVQHSRIGDLS